ncbi:eukaryotic translation initiation factor 2A [Hyalella azteca]|uniref:Eukaryotic translation initiation factor 2A n=1 Tax=Hyalella azteca TaxID=294128 RepID=A0A8B7NXE4_HYAAZ|nr:eukaryotic translation initiation factor 2A [Hyalella azteca]
MADNPVSSLQIAIHDSGGLHLVEGWPAFGKEKLEFKCAGKVKTFTFTKDGKKFALIANGCIQIMSSTSWTLEHTLEHPTAQEIMWSPAGNYLAVWCLYVKKGDTGAPNLHIYNTTGGCTLLKSFYQINQLNWEPQWTGDDSLMGRNVTNEVHFFKCPSLDKIAHKRVQPKLKNFSLSPSTSGHLVAFFTPSIKGAPCLANVYKYPHFKENSRPLVSKSFYNVDSVEFMWNKQCNAVLLLTSAEKSNSGSYYGERMVFLLNAKTEDAIRLTFNKDGPVNAVAWSPDGKTFLAVHGSNPAACSVFDAKGDLLHSLEEDTNVRQVWDLKKASRLCVQECPDVTFMDWSPCGRYLLTSTCSPRLRVNNGYRIYHYSGSLQFEYLCPAGTELYNTQWVPEPAAVKPFVPSAAKVAGITSAVKTASTERYIPPGQRAAMSAGDQYVLTCKQFLRQIDKYDPNSPAAAANQAPLSKTAARNKKRKEAKKAQELQALAEKNMTVFEEPEEFKMKSKKKEAVEAAVTTVQLSGDSEKKVKVIKKKLQRIEKLRKDKAEGKALDKQQTTLLESERELVAQLKSLAL